MNIWENLYDSQLLQKTREFLEEREDTLEEKGLPRTFQDSESRL